LGASVRGVTLTETHGPVVPLQNDWPLIGLVGGWKPPRPAALIEFGAVGVNP
jgi:hypothetical protein